MKRTVETLARVWVCAALALSAAAFASPGASADDADKGKEKKMTKTESGLQYRDATEGDGATAESGKRVRVHYTGWLWQDGKKGKKFDSSHDRSEPFEFPLGAGRVIQGWDEGVAGMKINGKRELLIPAELGYGANGFPPVIPANSTLFFEVELLGVR